MPAPGPAWVIQRLPHLILPPTLSYSILRFYDFHVWVCLLGMVISLPTLIVLRDLYSDISVRRGAWVLDAQLPPTVVDRTRTGLGLAKRLFDDMKSGYIGDVFGDLSAQYGGIFHFKMLSEHRVFTTEPEYIKAILATQFDDFMKGPISYSEFFSLFGQGVFNSDGDIRKFHRSTTRPFFVKERIGHFDIFERHAENPIQLTRQRIRDGYTVDFQDMVFRFTLDSATDFLFGQDVCSLSAGLRYPEGTATVNPVTARSYSANTFAHSITRAQELVAFRNRKGKNWPLTEFFEDSVDEHRKVVEKFVDPIIAEALRKKKELGVGEKDKAREDETLLDHLINCTEDRKIIRDEALNILIAGRDTTASVLTFMTYALSENPHILKKLRREILDKVGPTRRPTFENVKDMKYLRAVINETLRLYPPVPFNARTSRRATTFPAKTPGQKPWYIPPGVKVSYSVFLMHRREDLWGPDALEFDPERFIDDCVQRYLTKNPFIFLPFNGGPRICLGQQFAYNEISYFAILFFNLFLMSSLENGHSAAGRMVLFTWTQRQRSYLAEVASNNVYPRRCLDELKGG